MIIRLRCIPIAMMSSLSAVSENVDAWIHYRGTGFHSDTVTECQFRYNLSSFLTFRKLWRCQFAGGGIDFGSNFHGLPTGLTPDEFTSIEIRFGPGKTQKGHRFLFAGGFQYTFTRIMLDVPFEVWDTDNNVQLMVSWRDQENDSLYRLEDRATDATGIDRHYIFVHSLPYDPDNPDTNVAQTAGQAYKNTYAIWPEAPAGAGLVDPDTLSFDAIHRLNIGR